MAEPKEMPFRDLTHVGPRSHEASGDGNGRHLANTIERAVLGGEPIPII